MTPNGPWIKDHCHMKPLIEEGGAGDRVPMTFTSAPPPSLCSEVRGATHSMYKSQGVFLINVSIIHRYCLVVNGSYQHFLETS